MKSKATYPTATILLSILVSINAMEQEADPLSTKLHALKTNLGTLQDKLMNLREGLAGLKEQLQPEPSSAEDSIFEESSSEDFEEEGEQTQGEKSWVETIGDALAGYASNVATSLWQTEQKSELNWRAYELAPGSENPYGHSIVVMVYDLPNDKRSEELSPLSNRGRGRFGIRRSRIRDLPKGPPKSRYDYETRVCLASMSVSGYQRMFQATFPTGDKAKNEWSFLSNDEFYRFPNFLAYARSLASYDDYILNLKERIDGDKKFRATLKQVPGFKYSFGGKRQKSEFLDLIKAESNAIIDRRCAQNGCLDVSNKQELITLAEKYRRSNHAIPPKTPGKARLMTRLKTLDTVIKKGATKISYTKMAEDYPPFTDPYAEVFNHLCGTILDRRIHRELCDIRKDMMTLEHKYAGNTIVQSYSSMINRITALAKKEQNVEKAFNLSDFANDLLNLASTGIPLLDEIVTRSAKGIASGTAAALNPNTWKDMGIGILKLGVFLADEEAALKDLDRGLYTSMIVGDSDPLLDASSKYHKYYQEQVQAASDSYAQLMAEVEKMEWGDWVEAAAKFGTETVLMGVVCKSAKLGASKAGRELVSNAIKGLKSSAAEACMVEIATAGKIVLEEAAETAQVAIEVLKKNPTMYGQKGKIAVQTARNLANERGKAFEEFLVKKLGGRGSFRVGIREFDGAVGNTWYEAKSGEYWNALLSNERIAEKFRERMGTGLKIARENGATYELYSNTHIPQEVKDWLTKKGIPFTEFLEGK